MQIQNRFNKSSKRIIRVATTNGFTDFDSDYYEMEQVGIVKLDGYYNAIDAVTGIGLYRMRNVYDLFATLRDPQNYENLMKILKNLRNKYEHVKELI